jgi:hypothetical protein
MNGITVAHPAGWNIRPASQPWTGDLVFQLSPYADVIYQKDDDTPFIALASQALAGRNGHEWAADYLGQLDDECNGTAPVTVGGAPGLRGVDCHIAMVSVQDRGYLIWLYRIADEAYFNELLATVQLNPDEAATP